MVEFTWNYWEKHGFYWDWMWFYGELMGFYGDWIEFNGISWDFVVVHPLVNVFVAMENQNMVIGN